MLLRNALAADVSMRPCTAQVTGQLQRGCVASGSWIALIRSMQPTPVQTGG